jgi:hypothetical protein
MAKVRLTQDIMETDKIKQAPRRRPTFKEQIQRNPKTGETKIVEVPERVGSEPFLWTEGAVVEMSEASAKKYVESGRAEYYIEDEPEIESPPKSEPKSAPQPKPLPRKRG